MAKSKVIYKHKETIPQPPAKKGYLPHISRIINANTASLGLKMVILAVLIGFLAINLFRALPPDLNFEQARITVMLSPNDASSHLVLAQEYLKKGSMQDVERELNLAQELTSSYQPSASSSVLGSSLSPLKILEKIKNEPQRIRNEIIFWEKVVSERPGYRDGYLQLAILNYQLYENDKAKEYLNKALEIDPNFEVTKELGKIIQ